MFGCDPSAHAATVVKNRQDTHMNPMPGNHESQRNTPTKTRRAPGPTAHLLLLAALVSLVAGCCTARLESKKEAGYSKTIQRLYVQSELASASSRIGENAEREFTCRLSALKMDYKYVTVDTLATDADNKQLKKAVKDYAPEATLVLRATSATTRNEQIQVLKVTAYLWDETLHKSVWRANIETLASMRGFAEAIIKDLQKDKLIPGNPTN